jgi:uncharacterized protein (DUF486 family)
VPLWKVIVVSWGIAFFEYCLQCQPTGLARGPFTGLVEGDSEVITFTFWGLSRFTLATNCIGTFAFGCLVAGAFFMFHKF